MNVDLPDPDGPVTARNSPRFDVQVHPAQRRDLDLADDVGLREPRATAMTHVVPLAIRHAVPYPTLAAGPARWATALRREGRPHRAARRSGRVSSTTLVTTSIPGVISSFSTSV